VDASSIAAKAAPTERRQRRTARMPTRVLTTPPNRAVIDSPTTDDQLSASAALGQVLTSIDLRPMPD
jgi:hypothetical protein